MEDFFGMLFAFGIMYIIFGSIFGRLPGMRHSSRKERREREAALETVERDNAELIEQLSDLEERIKVLERIVTDDSQDLRRQFRDLGG